MDRKFAFIKQQDKDFQIVHDIKQLILNKQVNLILNLHDGHRFYRIEFYKKQKFCGMLLVRFK